MWKGASIGEHSVAFRRDGERLTVDTHIDISAKVLFFAVFRLKHDAQEIWQSGRLASVTSTTQRDGARLRVSGAAAPEGFRIVGEDGPFLAPAHLLTTNSLWDSRIVRESRLMDVQYGGEVGLVARLLGPEQVDTPRHGLRCAEVAATGPVANIESLRHERIDIGIVPSDVLADAVAGVGPFASRGPAAGLRVLFAGHADIFTLVARRESGVRTVNDLRGKRISIGAPGSRTRASVDRVMAALGLTRRDFAGVRELSLAEQNRAFCAGELDVIVYSVGHPNGLIRDATLSCRGMLVAVSGPDIDRMLSEYREYEPVVIPGGTYPVNPQDLHTVGVRAVVGIVAHGEQPACHALLDAVVLAAGHRLADHREKRPRVLQEQPLRRAAEPDFLAQVLRLHPHRAARELHDRLVGGGDAAEEDVDADDAFPMTPTSTVRRSSAVSTMAITPPRGSTPPRYPGPPGRRKDAVPDRSAGGRCASAHASRGTYHGMVQPSK